MRSNFDDPGPISLVGHLLVAHPQLQGTYFGNTVILLTEHSLKTGAHGYVINQPLGRCVNDLVPDLKRPEIALLPVLVAGPVEQDRLTFAHWVMEGVDSLQITTHLTLDDAAEKVAEGLAVVALLGYAGWSPGQLEDELKTESWIVKKPSQLILDRGSILSLWDALLPEENGNHLEDLLRRRPTDPNLN